MTTTQISVKKMLKQCIPIIIREFNYMWRDKGLLNIMLFAPLLGVAIFGLTYSMQTLNNIPTAIVDLDHSQKSRGLIDKFTRTEELEIISYPQNYHELTELIEQGDAVVGVVIPEDYGQDLILHRPTRVLTIIDGSNMIYATNAKVASTLITRTVSAEAGVKSLIARGMSLQEAKNAYIGADLRDVSWFNPTLNYAYFLVLGLILNIWQQCCTMASCMNIIGETGVKSWLQVKASGISHFKFFFSKSVAHIITFTAMVLPLYWLGFCILHIPIHCNFFQLLLFTAVFTISLHSVGTLMSSVANNAVDATRFGMMVALPSFVLSGYTWPIDAMPGFLQPLVKLLPQTWFFQGFNSLTFKNPGWAHLSHYYSSLLVIAVVCYSAAALITTWQEG